MKIFNIEDNKKKVYVQRRDLRLMLEFNSLIPVEVMNEVFGDILIVTSDTQYEFLEFSDPGTIEFFEGCDWILDFKKIKNLTEDEIISISQDFVKEKNQIFSELNSLDEKERNKYDDLLIKYKRLEYKIHSLLEILRTKQGVIDMPFPIVPDSGGFKVAEKEGCPYVAQQGINPLQVLVYRTDGTLLDAKRESFPQGLIQATESILINDNLEHNQYFGNQFERTRIISDDGKYLVTTFKIIPEEKVEKKYNDEKNTNVQLDKPKGLKKRIKNWFDKNFR